MYCNDPPCDENTECVVETLLLDAGNPIIGTTLFHARLAHNSNRDMCPQTNKKSSTLAAYAL